MTLLSSISSSSVGAFGRYGRFARKLILFLACVAVLEALSYLFVPPLHPLEAVSRRKPPLLQSVLDGSARYDTFFVGSSLTEDGLNADLFAQHFGGTAFNAGLAGTANVTFANSLIRQIIAKKHPSLVVYGIENFVLDRAAHEVDTQMFRFLNLYRQRYQIKKWVIQSLHGRFRAPPALWNAEAHVADFDTRFRHFDGAQLHPNGWVEVHATANFAWQIDAAPPPAFSFEPIHVQAIRDLEQLSRESGTAIVFVQFPQSVVAIYSTPDRLQGFRSFMSEYVEKAGFVYLDFNDGLTFPRNNPAMYFDKGHLNSDGASLFAPMLAAEIAKRCRHDGPRVICS